MSAEIRLSMLARENYGDEAQYRTHLFEQYKLYVEMADRLSARRLSSSAFYVSANTLLVALSSLAPTGGRQAVLLFLGVVLSVAWATSIRAYRTLSSGKFAVIHELEALLPCAPYETEWRSLAAGNNPARHRPLTKVEVAVPVVFVFVYAYLLLLMWFGS